MKWNMLNGTFFRENICRLMDFGGFSLSLPIKVVEHRRWHSWQGQEIEDDDGHDSDEQDDSGDDDGGDDHQITFHHR